MFPVANCIIVDLSISTEEFVKLYQGAAQNVYAVSRDGRSIRFPANVLRPFVSHDGIRGSFCIYFDHEHKFQSIDRL